MVGLTRKNLRKIKFKPLKQKPLPGRKKRLKIARKVRKRLKKAFPIATLPLR